MKTKKIITIILIIAWMATVFYLSNQGADDSNRLSGGFTRVVLNFFHVLDEKTLEQQAVIETIFRKLAHYTLYTLGGILILLHVNLYNIQQNKRVILTQIIGTTYAITDEIHQLFVPGRSEEIRDVFIDSLGIITGIIILLAIIYFKNKLFQKEGTKVGK